MSEVEKKTAYFQLRCKPSEKKQWFDLFEPREIGRMVRAFLNKAAAKKTLKMV